MMRHREARLSSRPPDQESAAHPKRLDVEFWNEFGTQRWRSTASADNNARASPLQIVRSGYQRRPTANRDAQLSRRRSRVRVPSLPSLELPRNPTLSSPALGADRLAIREVGPEDDENLVSNWPLLRTRWVDARAWDLEAVHELARPPLPF